LRQKLKTPLAIFFLDALRYSDINRVNTPFLAQMMNEGLSGPLETLVAYEGIAATILTGTYPTTHGIWTRYYLDPESSPFKWISPFSWLLEKLNGSLETTRAKLVRYAIMRLTTFFAGISFFPGLDEVPLKQLSQLDFSVRKKLFEPGCFGNTPSLFDILIDNGLSYHYVDHDLFDTDETVFRKAFNKPLTETVTMVRFIDLDTASHRYGIDSPERNQIVKRTDRFVERIVSNWKSKNPSLSVICFADHGMVKAETFIDMEKIIASSGLKQFQEFGFFLDSTMARFWAKDKDVLHHIREKLSRVDYGTILSESERAAYHIPASPRWGNMIFLVKPGYVISPNFFEKTSHVKAMHGYDPATPGLNTILTITSPKIGHGRQCRDLKMVDILPTTLDLLGLPIPPYCEGKSLVGNADL
jgi:predicted AlkP superfamily pyrophosphatase or phosphodiesterase